MEFCNGLEEIGEDAFCKYRSRQRIDIPPAIRAIKDGAFYDCSGLTTVILGNGLEEIGESAFDGCACVRITIPPNVRTIHVMAFKRCSDLTTITICNEIKAFVSGESMRDWWNSGVHEK